MGELAQKSARSIPALTGLRGVTALWVLSYHVHNEALSFNLRWLANFSLFASGWHGVDLFFLLSGFVLMLGYERDFVTPNGRNIAAFFKLRVARVYPLNLVVLILIAALVILDPAFANDFRASDPSNFTLGPFLKTTLLATRWGLPGHGEWNEPVWSLSAEILGYVAFPAIAWMLVRRPSLSMSVCLATGALASLAFVQIATGTGGLNMGNLIRMGSCFVAGAGISQIFRRAPARLGALSPVIGAVAAALVVVIALAERLEWGMASGFAFLVLALAYERGTINRALSSPVALFLGRISFPLYLFHLMPLTWLAFHLRSSHPSSLMGIFWLSGYFAFVIAASYGLHRWVELPTHRLGRQWAAWRRPLRHNDELKQRIREQVEAPLL